MPETTNNDAPGADRPTARAGQEGPSKTGAAARPPGEMEAEQQAREAVRSAAAGGVAGGAAERTSPDGGSPTDTAP
jgi:hypothetical protein